MTGKAGIVLEQGDITDQEVDAIVNAANSGLRGGGGVDGAIHRAGGPTIMQECREIRRRQGGCPTGQAVLTGAGQLKARRVIHAVAPIWSGGDRGEADLLAGAYRTALLLAAQNGLETVAFPSLGTGAYGYPVDQAARIALGEVTRFLRRDRRIREVRFVLFSAADLQTYEVTLASLTGG